MGILAAKPQNRCSRCPAPIAGRPMAAGTVGLTKSRQARLSPPGRRRKCGPAVILPFGILRSASLAIGILSIAPSAAQIARR
jgi:hypothetical protein